MCKMEVIIKIFNSRGFLTERAIQLLNYSSSSLNSVRETKTEAQSLPPANGFFSGIPTIREENLKDINCPCSKKKKIAKMHFPETMVYSSS